MYDFHVLELGVKALIRYNDEFLFLKRSSRYGPLSGSWDIPGGRIHFGEEPLDGLMREIYEETKMPVSIVGVLDVSTVLVDPSVKRHIVRATYLCSAGSKKVIISSEHTAALWSLPSSIYPELSDPVLKRVLTQYL